MRQWLGILAASAFAAIAATAPVQAGPTQPGALSGAAQSTCVIEIASANGDTIQIQNLCRNPVAVRINWGEGRMFDYCLNSSGDLRYVVKRSSSYQFTREQAVLICQ